MTPGVERAAVLVRGRGETDRLGVFTAARKALRQKSADPFHWAPFLDIGSPE